MTLTPEPEEFRENEKPAEIEQSDRLRKAALRQESQGLGCLGGCAVMVLAFVGGIAMLIVAGRMGMHSADGVLERMADYLTGRTTTIDVSQAAVVERVRKLARLETVDYSMEKIVVGERASKLLPDALVGDKLLLVAHGEVIAGVDLSQLQPGDVSVSGDLVRLKMPKPMIFSARLDNAKTRVFSRVTGMMVGADPNLETEVRQAAEEQIGQAAIDDGILDKAKANGQATLEALLSGLGFRRIEVY